MVVTRPGKHDVGYSTRGQPTQGDCGHGMCKWEYTQHRITIPRIVERISIVEVVEVHAEGYNCVVCTEPQSTRLNRHCTSTQNANTKNRHKRTIFLFLFLFLFIISCVGRVKGNHNHLSLTHKSIRL